MVSNKGYFAGTFQQKGYIPILAVHIAIKSQEKKNKFCLD